MFLWFAPAVKWTIAFIVGRRKVNAYVYIQLVANNVTALSCRNYYAPTEKAFTSQCKNIVHFERSDLAHGRSHGILQCKLIVYSERYDSGD